MAGIHDGDKIDSNGERGDKSCMKLLWQESQNNNVNWKQKHTLSKITPSGGIKPVWIIEASTR
jgi:hypothetical protein